MANPAPESLELDSADGYTADGDAWCNRGLSSLRRGDHGDDGKREQEAGELPHTSRIPARRPRKASI